MRELPTMTSHRLFNAAQSLTILPQVGGSVARWQWHQNPHTQKPFKQALDLWRWRADAGPFAVEQASMPMLPWCNRISQGGFHSPQGFHAIEPNTADSPLPIHGDGFLQSWQVTQSHEQQLTMCLRSRRFQGNPYDYEAVQTLTLRDNGMTQSLRLTHLGEGRLPYGLGQHPWFDATTATQTQASVEGYWPCDASFLPVGYSQDIPPNQNPNRGMPTTGTLINHLYSPWNGLAQVHYPAHGLSLTMQAHFKVLGKKMDGCLMIYRPTHEKVFCLEPVSHPVDAFHLEGQQGLQWLSFGEHMELELEWDVNPLG